LAKKPGAQVPGFFILRLGIAYCQKCFGNAPKLLLHQHRLPISSFFGIRRK